MQKTQEFEVIHPHCAGIDIGSKAHYVGIPPDRQGPTVREFGCFTADLKEMAGWLIEQKVTVAFMESTGSYWFEVYETLEQFGITAVVVDARNVKRLPGHKTDVKDCQWIQRMGSCGLLAPCFAPEARLEDLRTYPRHRQNLTESASQQVLRMPKAMTEMNVQLHHAISDITGVSGLAMIKAILAGERDPKKLAQLRDYRVKASEETICKDFCSWLGLSPDHKKTGGKVRSRKTRTVNSRAALSFRLAAQGLTNSHSYLGAFIKGLAARRGMPKAITATARKLAVIFYTLVKNPKEYIPKTAADYDEMHRERTLRYLTKRAKKLGHALVEIDAGGTAVC